MRIPLRRRSLSYSIPASSGYQVRDASDTFGGHQIAAVQAVDLPGGGEIRVEFHDAPAVILRDVDDSLSFQIQRDATQCA